MVGVTTNPTIFAKAISGGGEAYAGQLHDLWARGTCVHEALRDMTTHDVRWACDVLRGRAAIANARLAYQHYERMLASTRWAALAAAGARPQRPLWASTSVKDPAYPDTRYVTDLVAPGVVNTMPEATLRAVADHGQIPADSVRGHYQDARQVLSELAAAGVDYDDVTAGLEQHGLELFDASWRELSDQLAAKLRKPCH